MGTFNPVQWLASFKSVGGAYVLTETRLSLWVFPGDYEDEDLSEARILINDLTPDKRDRVVSHLRSEPVGEA